MKLHPRAERFTLTAWWAASDVQTLRALIPPGQRELLRSTRRSAIAPGRRSLMQKNRRADERAAYARSERPFRQ
jgi:hypothetical protein